MLGNGMMTYDHDTYDIYDTIDEMNALLMLKFFFSLFHRTK